MRTDKAAHSKQGRNQTPPRQLHKSTQSAKSATQKKKPADAKTAKKSAEQAAEKTESVGEPLAAGMMKLLQEEIVLGIRGRNITDRFARFQSYAAGRVNATAGGYTGSELTGNCRIRWYNHMMQNMLAARPRPNALPANCT